MARPRNSSLLLAIGLGGTILAGACSPQLNTRGNVPDPDLVAEIVAGQHTRDDVAEILGSPSTASTFGAERWIYIGKRTETLAFFAPEVEERQVLVVRFDKAGVVAQIQRLDLEDGRVVQVVERQTPTLGNELTVFDQLLGNLGRFNKDTGP